MNQNHKFPLTLKVLRPFILLALLPGLLDADPNTLATSVQHGLLEEEVNRNFKAAVTAYETAVTQFDADRNLAATAIFRLAENYRRAGRIQEANILYERMVREFHDHSELARLATERLPEEKRTALADGAPSIPEMTEEEARELQRLQLMLRQSPDRLDLRDAEDGNGTPLHRAVENGYLHAARLLIEAGANLEVQTHRLNLPKPSTPLDLAAQNGHQAMVLLLLEYGADVEGSSFGASALDMAADRGFRGTVEVLLEHGANVEGSPNRSQTPLHAAARKGHTEVVKLLLEAGADVNATDFQGATPLHSTSSPPVVTLLLDHSADIHAKTKHSDFPVQHGMTPLALAVQQSNLVLVRLLVERGADPTARNESGLTPGDYLPDDSNKTTREIASFLRAHGASEPRNWAAYRPSDNQRDEMEIVFWPPGETMTLMAMLRELGVDLAEVGRVEIGHVEGLQPRRTRGRIFRIPDILHGTASDPDIRRGSIITPAFNPYFPK